MYRIFTYDYIPNWKQNNNFIDKEHINCKISLDKVGNVFGILSMFFGFVAIVLKLLSVIYYEF
jgi:hypothetical protein